MCGNSAVFYLGYGEVPCDKFCRIKRRKKNDSMYDSIYDREECQLVSTACSMYQNIPSDVLGRSCCVPVQVLKCISHLLLSVVMRVNEAMK